MKFLTSEAEIAPPRRGDVPDCFPGGGGAAPGFGGAASGFGGVASVFGGAPGGGLLPGARGTAVGDGRSGGVGKLLAGVFSSIGGVAADGLSFAASLSSGTAAGFCGAIGVSTLPRMTGKPSFPLPMITILVLGDWAS
jgi:hypothetical protein